MLDSPDNNDFNDSEKTSQAGGLDDVLEIVVKSFLDQLFPRQGLLLLDERKQLKYHNQKAQDLCQALAASLPPTISPPTVTTLAKNSGKSEILFPAQLSKLCQSLIDAQASFPDQALQLYEEITLPTGQTVRITGRWIQLQEKDTPYILLRLEDVADSASQQARSDAYQYGLTTRQMEVWALHLQGLPRTDIAQKLYIELCTVKKHMKNIYNKRRGEAG